MMAFVERVLYVPLIKFSVSFLNSNIDESVSTAKEAVCSIPTRKYFIHCAISFFVRIAERLS